MRKIFLSFADSRMSAALQRIQTQAQVMGCYDHIVVADESYLNIDFREKYKEKLKPTVRGYGYWCWKPQVILQLLDQIDDGDIIQYTDAGCHLNPAGMTRLMEYFDLANTSKSGILAFAAIAPSFHKAYIKLPEMEEYRWCKSDLFNYFRVRDRLEIVNSPTIGAGIIFIKKTPESMGIIKKWLEVISDDFTLLDDTPSLIQNMTGFVEHRHDQSIFSLLCKLRGAALISAYEYWYPLRFVDYPDWRELKDFPIHAKRDKGLGFFLRTMELMAKVLKRLKRLGKV
jgi:hypothetical protein